MRDVWVRVGSKEQEAMGAEETPGAPERCWDTLCEADPHFSFFSSFYDENAFVKNILTMSFCERLQEY